MAPINDPRHCDNCHHRIESSSFLRQEALYGKATSIETCEVRGIIISTDSFTSQQAQARRSELATTCQDYNRSGAERTVTLRLGFGAPEAPPSGGQQTRTKTCRGCYFYLPAQKVATAFPGVPPMGACAKFGRLIPEMKASDIAKNCSESRRLSNEVSDPEVHHKMLVDSIVLDPSLAKYLTPGDEPASLDDRVDTSLEPSEYPSDRPVSPKQTAMGIRAWRRITSGNRELFIPVFERSFFTEEEQAKIPATGDDEHPEQYADHMNLAYQVAALWFHLDETPALNGNPGSGKTEFFRYMAWLMQVPFERVSVTRDTEIDDLAGKMHFENNETVFKPGRIPKAWVKPNVLVLDEPNTGPPEVWQYIRPLTDNSKQLVNDRNEGETIHRHQFAFLGMAMNPAWDARNIGAEQIGDADGSRLMHIFVDMPDEKTERKIIRARCELDGYELPEDTEDHIINIAQTLREMGDNGELPLTWGIRNQIKVARATAWFSVEKAYDLGVLDYLEPDLKKSVRGVIDAELNTKRGRSAR